MSTQPKIFEDLEGPDFVRSSDVEAVAEKVLELHGAIGGVIPLHPIAEAIRDGELSILWLLNEKPWNDEVEDDQQPEVAGRCVKAPGLWHDVTGHHFAIWARKHFWDQFSIELRRALVLHELLHIEVKRDKDGQPKFSVRKHDVEDFVDVARQYGPAALAGEGARYVRAAALFADVPESLGARRSLSDARAAEIVKPLQDVADAMGSDITISAGGRSATIRGKAQAAARPAASVTPDDRIGELLCQGSNHVPGHTAGCPMFTAS
jgi:hypothetical protein